MIRRRRAEEETSQLAAPPPVVAVEPTPPRPSGSWPDEPGTLREPRTREDKTTSAKSVEVISRGLKPRSGRLNYWGESDVVKAATEYGVFVPEGASSLHLQLLANYAYAEFYGSSIKTEVGCIEWASDILRSRNIKPDKYIAALLSCF